MGDQAAFLNRHQLYSEWYDVPMNGSRNGEASAKLRTALDMFGLGESIMRQKLRRTHPGAPEAEIESMLSAWLLERPGAEHRDAPGKVRRPAE